MFIKLTPEFNKIKSNRIIIWQFPTDNYFPDAKKHLSEEETSQADRFYYDYHRIRYTISHAMTRAILAQYANISPEKLIFAKQKHGKPYLVNASEISFNLTHSKNLALLAVSLEDPIGIDVEYFKPRGYLGIGNMMYSQAEMELLNNSPLHLQPLVFFKIWSQKEAVIKAEGCGIYCDTKGFDVKVLPNNYAIEAFGQEWEIKTFTPKPLYFGAICHKNSVTEIYYKTLDISNYDAILKF